MSRPYDDSAPVDSDLGASPPEQGSNGDEPDHTTRANSANADGTQSYEFVNPDSPRRLDHLLAEWLPEHSRAYLQKLIEQGCVRIPGLRRDVRASLKVPTGVAVRCDVPPPRKADLTPQDIPIPILIEDEHLAVIDKPAGLAVHPAPSQVGYTLVNALLYWLKDLSGIGGEERPGIVHRLDKETSGILIVAKNDFAHRSLAAQFKERTVHKTYIAITRGQPTDWEGRIDYALGRSYTHSKKQMIRVDGTGREAVTNYRVLEKFRGYALIELYPKTGRTHQLRVHLASQRLPIAADKLYGREKRIFLSDIQNQTRSSDEEPILSRHALHAANISFSHPLTREEITVSAAIPDDMLSLLKSLEKHRSPR